MPGDLDATKTVAERPAPTSTTAARATHEVTAPDPASRAEAAPGDRIGRFEVTSVLGAGNMGVVYLARDPELGRKVAIKVLLRHAEGSSGDRARRRLQREAQAMAQIIHPNLVTVYDVGRHRGHVFIAMEYVSGTTLRRWLTSKERRWSEIVRTFAAAGRGLAAAHAAGIVHRDFKPDNTLVAEDGSVKVVDFGLAVEVTPPDMEPEDTPSPAREDPLALRLTQTGVVMGTPAYMSPEQHEGRPTDARTDQFSFGVALFEALYGRRPFEGKTWSALAQAVAAGEVVEVERGEVPARVDAAVRRAIVTDRDERHADMNALLAELEPAPETGTGGRRGTGALVVGGGLVAVAAAISLATLGQREPDEGTPPDAVAAPAPATPALVDEDPAATAALMKVILAPNDAERLNDARAYLSAYGETGGVDRRVIVEGMLGGALWRSSCADAKDGLCITIGDVAPDERYCKQPLHGPIEVTAREPDQARRGLEHLERAVTLAATTVGPSTAAEQRAFVDTVAMAQTTLADAKLERFLVERLPRGPAERWAESLDRIEQESARIASDYAAVEDAGSDFWSVVAAGRTGMLFQSTSEQLLSMPEPVRDQSPGFGHCHSVLEAATPLRQRAGEAFGRCSRQATRAKLSKGLVVTCDERLSALSTLTRQDMRVVVRNNIDKVRECYEAELQEDPTVAGKVITRFNIGPDGTVTDASAVEGSTLPVRMQECTVAVIEGLTFPFPGEAGTMTTYPFEFSPG